MGTKLEVFLRSLAVGVAGGVLTGALMLGVVFAAGGDDPAERLEGLCAGMLGGGIYGLVCSTPPAFLGAGLLTVVRGCIRRPSQAVAVGVLIGAATGVGLAVWIGVELWWMTIPMAATGGAAALLGCFGLGPVREAVRRVRA